MHADGVRSWESREDASREILVGLYVRDALGVTDPSGLPRLLGTGLSDPERADEMTNWWWQRWWIAILDPDEGRGFGLPTEAGEVGDRALRRHLDDARTWADVAHEAYDLGAVARARTGDLPLNHVVAERAAALDRPVNPFRLRIEVLPLTTAGIWWIGEHAIAVDELLRDDPASYALALEPIIERLA
ncbi:MAG: hypothetical protein ABIR17_05155 [Pseudolysinimonas sp.]|uniref:hypothetical protein n=1 Tax=Pseudolysinimonas sp. TaxID=2680009 RepID=UPI003267AC48